MLTLRSVTIHGNRRWRVDSNLEGRRVRSVYRTKAEAEAQIEALKLQRRQAGDAWLTLSPAERNDVMTVWQEIESAGTSLRAVWQHWQECQHIDQTPPLPLGQAIELLIQSKDEAQRRPAYIRGLHQILKRFARGREDLPVSQLSVVDIETWLGDNARTPGSRATMINRLSTLFAFLRRRRLVRENPCEFIDRPTIEQGPPAILTVEQCQEALAWSHKQAPRFLAWLTLGLFAGIRPNELDRLNWRDIDLEAGLLRIDAAASKVRQRRIVHLEPAARAWLGLAKKLKSDLPLPHVTRRRQLRALREHLGFEDWPKDVLRHTAASHLLAIKKDAAAVALELGNSPQILLKHYRELVTRDQAKAFWNLRP